VRKKATWREKPSDPRVNRGYVSYCAYASLHVSWLLGSTVGSIHASLIHVTPGRIRKERRGKHLLPSTFSSSCLAFLALEPCSSSCEPKPIPCHSRRTRAPALSPVSTIRPRSSSLMAAERAKGEWIPSTVTVRDLQSLEDEGFIPSRALCSWRSAVGDQTPAPREGEIVCLVSHIDRGISFPLSDFCSAVLAHFRVQPFQLTPNSVLIMSGFAALCEGYLGVRPQLDLFRFYYQIKRVTIHSGGPLQRCGSMTFKIRRNRTFPEIAGHESVKGWTGSYFYCKDIPKADHDFGWPAFVDGPPSRIRAGQRPLPIRFL
jgi:hypothetical protein